MSVWEGHFEAGYSDQLKPSALGRFLPVFTTVCAGQVKCKRLVGWNAVDWSVAVQIGDQINATAHPQHPSAPTYAALANPACRRFKR